MYGNMSALNLFGFNNLMEQINSPSRPAAVEGDTSGNFAGELFDLLAQFTQQRQAGTPTINNATPANSGLDQLYRDAMAMSYGGETSDTSTENPFAAPAEDSDADAAVTDTSTVIQQQPNTVTDPSTLLNTTDRVTSAQTSTTMTMPTGSIREIVMTTGSLQSTLISKMNVATTKADRLQYAAELRDAIVTNLRNAGHTVETTESIDKIVIDGKTFDVIRKYDVLGKNAKVQLLDVDKHAGATQSFDPVPGAIYKATEEGIDLLLQMRNTSDVEAQRALAIQLQHMVAQNLKDAGYHAVTQASPDKIKIDGVSYDFIRNLGGFGNEIQFQAMKMN